MEVGHVCRGEISQLEVNWGGFANRFSGGCELGVDFRASGRVAGEEVSGAAEVGSGGEGAGVEEDGGIAVDFWLGHAGVRGVVVAKDVGREVGPGRGGGGVETAGHFLAGEPAVLDAVFDEGGAGEEVEAERGGDEGEARGYGDEGDGFEAGH